MQLIKNNPYRIVGLLVGAKAKVQDRQIRRLKQIIDAEQEPEDDFSFPKLGKLNRTIDVVNDAASKLNLDNDKMDAALFWFYNGNEITDEPAFDLLKDGKIKETASIWTKLVKDKPVESKNASAFHNLSTLFLNHAIKDDIIKENLLEDGIWLKLKFLESDFVKDLKALATDETYRTTKKELQLTFLNQVQSEIEKHGGITSNKFLEILKKQEFVAKEDFLKGFVQKPIEQIESKIEEAKSKRKANKANGIIAGKILFENTSEYISLLKSILGISSINFTSISDRVSDEILQCGIDYFLHFRDTNTDPGSASMDLFCKAETLAIGKIAKQRCQENTHNLQEWINTSKERNEINRIQNYCWYCNENLANEKYIYQTEMYRETSRSGIIQRKVTYQKCLIKINRCQKCSEVHGKGSNAIFALFILLYIVSFVLFYFYVIKPDGDWTPIFMFIFLGWIPAAIINWIITYIVDFANAKKFKIKNASDINQHPFVKEMVKQNWSFTEPSAR